MGSISREKTGGDSYSSENSSWSVSFYGGGSTSNSDRKLTDKTKVEDQDNAIVSDDERIEKWTSNSTNGSMTIIVTGTIGDGNSDVSGSFDPEAIISMNNGQSDHTVEEDGVKTYRYFTKNHGNSSSYTLDLDLSGNNFDFTFDAGGGNSMSGSTVGNLTSQTTTATKPSRVCCADRVCWRRIIATTQSRGGPASSFRTGRVAIATRCHTIRSRTRFDSRFPTGVRIEPPRATLFNRFSPLRLATSVDPPPLLRNRPAIGRGMPKVKNPMSKRKRKAESGGKVMFNFKGSMFKISDPRSLLSRRATSEYETNQNPKYFPIYFKTVPNSRDSSKDPKDGKM